jgi:nucleotide-binding universal stress UspA family protein
VANVPGRLVCMATRGHTAAGSLLLGSVAEEVVTTVDGEVVLVGPHCSPRALSDRDGRSLVVGFDGTDASAELVPPAALWARRLGLEVHLVTVVHDDGARVGSGPVDPVREWATNLVERLVDDGMPARLVFVDDDDAADGLTGYAREHDAALIATGAGRHPRGLARAVLGPTALAVVRHATVPVIVQRPAPTPGR